MVEAQIVKNTCGEKIVLVIFVNLQASLQFRSTDFCGFW